MNYDVRYEVLNKVCEKVEKKLNDDMIWACVFPHGHDMPVIDVEINWGDWKHDHWRARYLIEQMGYIHLNTVVTEEDGSDCYSAVHRFFVEEAA